MWKHRKNRHDTQDPNFDYEAWKQKHTAFADVAVPKWVNAVKKSYGTSTTKFACVGYCFGAPYVCNELKGDTVTVGAFAHPAFLKEHHFEQLKSKSPRPKPVYIFMKLTRYRFSRTPLSVLLGDRSYL